MRRYRILALLAVVTLALPLIAGPAAAWEVNVKGVYSWYFDYLGQRGHQGFFGAYDADAGAGTFNGQPINQTQVGAYASLNGWMGERWPTGIVSGSDAQWTTQKMDFQIQIKLNPAIRVDGTYRIGEWFDQGALTGNQVAVTTVPATSGLIGAGTADRMVYGLGNLVNSEYLESRSSGINRSMSPGYWNTLFMVVDLPVGRITFGKRPSMFGPGLMWNGADSRSSEKLAIAVPYGPFSIVAGFDVSRRATDAGQPPVPGTFASGAPYFNNDFDRNNNRLWDATGTITYRQGCMDFGVTYNWVHAHRGGEGLLLNPTTAAASPNNTTKLNAAYRDQVDQYGGAYVRYFNGRFFSNAEIDFYQLANFNRQKTNAGARRVGIRDTYTEHWRWMLEAGVVAGPSKVSVLYAWLEGDDRRGGQFLQAGTGTSLTQTAGFVDFIDKRGTLRAATASNTGVFKPYSYLMVYRYGLGMSVNPDTGYGYAEDASIWAARADYSVAANLNIFGSFFYADRQSKSGWGWGCIKPDLANVNQTGQFRVWRQGIDAAPSSTLVATAQGSFRGGAPNIPDTQLGWEVDAGFSWRLLEGLTLDFTAAYWKPGEWFKWACVDKRVPNWYTNGGATPVGNPSPFAWGVNPDRSIDAIWGMEFAVRGEF